MKGLIRGFIYIFGTFYITIISILIASKRQKPIVDSKPLPDIGHEIFPRIPQFIPDILVLFSILSLVFLRCIPSANYVKSICLVYILRSIIITSTIYPPPRILLYGSCADLMFSGHTVTFYAVADLLDAHTQSCRITTTILLRVIFPITLISARMHYTSDVLVAAAIMHLLPGRESCLMALENENNDHPTV